MSEIYDKIIDVLKSNQTFCIASHAHPDGDGIGSTLALGLVLKSMGKDVLMYNQDGVPHVVDFFVGTDQLVTEIAEDATFDVSIMLDCGQPERAGRHFPPKERRGQLLCIDHHVTGGDEADLACRDKTASSTGELIYNILKRMGVEVDADIATLILTSIIVDTGFFRYSNTTKHALTMAAELVEKGASTWVISKNMEERVHPNQYRLMNLAIDTMEYLLNGQMAVMVLTDQMFRDSGAGVDMAEEFINVPRSVKGVRVAVLLREKANHEYKISFRSKDTIDVAKLVRQFDGGGHEHAAGCTIRGPLGSVKQIIEKAVAKAIKSANSVQWTEANGAIV